MKRLLPYLLGFIFIAPIVVSAETITPSIYKSSEDFARYAMKLRENALSQIEPKVFVPTTSSSRAISGKYPWKNSIVTTTFWVGEGTSANNPVHNRSSSWDSDWAGSYGGYDNPDPGARKNFIPANFVPRQNPFYFALPYNDVTMGHFKPEASRVIPWYATTVERDGKSVCKDRWICIRKGSKVCYAQWSDCGPFRTDHFQYVFGNDRPKPNLNGGAGLDISPAVRDYLGLAPTDVTDWKFVEVRDVTNGPWARYGDNNTVAQLRGRSGPAVASNAPVPSSSGSKSKARISADITADGPTVITR